MYHYEIKVKCFNEEVYNHVKSQLESQLRCRRWSIDNFFICSSEEGFVFTASIESNFYPIVGFDVVAYDTSLYDMNNDKDNKCEITICAKGMPYEERYKKIGQATHFQFVGTKEYVDSKILINTDDPDKTDEAVLIAFGMDQVLMPHFIFLHDENE
jgi:hypothetical protein